MGWKMLKKRIIPLLLLKNGRMVKGKKFSTFIDTGNPETAVKIYSSQDADELMFLDILASLESRNILLETISKAAKQCTMPFSVGGGIKTVEDVKEISLKPKRTNTFGKMIRKSLMGLNVNDNVEVEEV